MQVRVSSRTPGIAVVALALLLTLLAVVIVIGDRQLSTALHEQERTAANAAAFAEAGAAVMDEALAAQTFLHTGQATDGAGLRRSLDRARSDLLTALRSSGLGGTRQGTALSDRQRSLDVLARQVIRLTVDQDPDAEALAADVMPAVAEVRYELESVSERYRQLARDRREELGSLHRRVSQVQALAGLLTAVAVALLLRLLLLIRRRETTQARLDAHAAVHDPLTGLGNRAMIRSAAGRLLRNAAIPSGPRERGPVAVLIDLDAFKAINDTYGHPAGDLVLVAVADCLRPLVEQERGDLLVRLGGDEFAAMLFDRSEDELREWSVRAATVLRREVALPAAVSTNGRDERVAVSGSVGATCAIRGDTLESLHRRADAALYRAKAGAGLRVHVIGVEQALQFALEPPAPTDTAVATVAHRLPSLPASAQMRSDLRALLDSGDDHRRLLVHYQPVVDARTRAVRGVEALVRWQHPERGLLRPAQFLPIALRSADLLAFSELVVLRVVEDLPEIADLVTAGGRRTSADAAVRINIAANALAAGAGTSLLTRLAQRGIVPGTVRVEVAQFDEHAGPDQQTALIGAIEQLRAAGIGCTLDHVGAGPGELDALKQLPVDALKVDRHFVGAMTAQLSAARGLPGHAHLGAVVALATSFGLRAQAQGVQDAETFSLLRQLGFDTVQGHYLAPPMPRELLAGQLAHLDVQAGEVAAH